VAATVGGMPATVGDTLRDAQARIERAGSDTPRLDAELLLASALGCDRAGLVLRRDEPFSDGVAFSEMLARRCAREPVAYITGVKGFRHITLQVDRRVLIPRPETELLVEVGLTLDHGAAVVDVGTGSGAVALALKDERPDLVVTGFDVSEDALAVARENAARLALDVRLARSDLLERPGGYDAILANLPYVADGAELPPEIARYEPRGALFAGADGLSVIRRLVGQVGGARVLGLEIGLGQAEAVEAMVRAAGFASVQRLRDLAGIERVVVGRR
jgi:release factor glutamine methyltransferase